MARTQKTNQSISPFEQFAIVAVAILILFFVGRQLYQAEPSEASVVGRGGSPYIFISDQGNDQFDGSYLRPFRSIRKAADTASSTKYESLIIGVLGDSYTVTATDTSGMPWLEGNIKFTGKAQLKLTGIEVDSNSEGEVSYSEQPVDIEIPDFPGEFRIEVERGVLTLQDVDFLVADPVFGIARTDGRLVVKDSSFEKSSTMNWLPTLLDISSISTGQFNVLDSDFYLRQYTTSYSEASALRAASLGDRNSTVANNSFYFPFIDQPPSADMAEPSYFQFVGVDSTGNNLTTTSNLFTIDSEQYPGRKTPTEYSKSNLGIWYKDGADTYIQDNDFSDFFGTPIVVSPVQDAKGQQRDALITGNHS